MIYVLALAGLLISLYAFYVQRRLRSTPSFSPLCDLKKNISCSKAFTSNAGYILGPSNIILGLIFYPVIIIVHYLGLTQYVYAFTFSAVIVSAYLAYLSYVKQKNFCLVCSAIYLINIALFIVARSA